MATQEVIVDHPQLPQNPIDTSVIIPDHVKRAAELAESFYKQPEPAPAAEAAPVEQPAAETPPAVQSPPLQPAAPQDDYVAPASKEEVHSSDWAARYNSMRGRWEASQRTIGSMQEQMSQLGDELMRTQQLLRGQDPNPQQQPRQNNARLITAEDEQAYGPELIDLARRAAMETVGPEIENLREENNSLKKRVTDTAKTDLRQRLTTAIPNWRTINASPEFKSWLRLPNVYTREVRQSMLDRAYAAADVPAVVEFFKDFLREGIATGQMAPAPQHEQPVPQAPRAAAVPLESLSAPGRARPASGEFSNAPADKPIYTRAQVKAFYDNVRRGAYAGRETEKASLEQSIFAAQNDGRVR